MSTPSPNGVPGHPRRSAMKADGDTSDRTPPSSTYTSSKAVQIADPRPSSADESLVKKQHSAGIGKRLGGRPPLISHSSKASNASQTSLEGSGITIPMTSSPNIMTDSQDHQSRHRHTKDRASERFMAQVGEWLQREKQKREHRKSLKLSSRRRSPPLEKADGSAGRPRASSIDSNSSEVSLDRLQRILDDSMSALGLNDLAHFVPRLGKKHSRRSLKNLTPTRTASSDTEFYDGDVVVPSCEAFLDNSKTLSYSGGKTGADDAVSLSSRKEEKEKQAWLTFKNEIIRLAHTLKLKGWRRVPLDGGDLISVERLSGALTNAVYVVSPPKESALLTHESKKTPTKVLLRIYGPQVEHLIDREIELGVLRRLARKKIGPRLLGTFLNGRFEQYFNSTTLTPANLREPETSKQIAKRMRELHDGVELLDNEKNEGPGVWKNWDKWLEQAEKTVTFLDKQVQARQQETTRPAKDSWKGQGYVCGVPWAVFKETVQRYRKHLDDYYGSPKKIRQKLVFAHNDTQYGNILRIRPDDQKSPLLQPANEHKQLIVIDFEYAGANTPGYEFANHFAEWTYNYHDPVFPHVCDTSKYPNIEQQKRFIKAYVDHRPQFPFVDASTPKASASGAGTPTLQTQSSASSIVDFMLDARAPAGGWKEEEKRREEEVERRVKELMEETRLWRIANSAQWVVWGIIQAKIPGLKSTEDEVTQDSASVATETTEESEEGEDEFDYLGYSQERAFFFWADCILMGFVKAEELPEEIRPRLKYVRY